MKIRLIFLILFIISYFSFALGSSLNQIWLTYAREDPGYLTINWASPKIGDAEIWLWSGEKWKFHKIIDENKKLHHIEVPIPFNDVQYHYKIRTSKDTSAWYTFRGIPKKAPLKLVFIADWGYAGDADLSVILGEKPSIIFTCGDNVPDIYRYGEQGDIHCVNSFLKLVNEHPILFRSIPFMPILGNHDKQIYPRGSQPPRDLMVYDTNATAYCEFFELPGTEWKWAFHIPYYHIRILALDLNHIRDYGTTWQTCHAYNERSEQYNWYKREIDKKTDDYFTITIHNTRNVTIRQYNKELWEKLFRKGSIVITGFGYFAEKAIFNSVTYYNTALKAGDVYPDPDARFTKGIANYILLTANKDSILMQIKSLRGVVLDEATYYHRKYMKYNTPQN